jgi:hypothetical protein
LGARNWEVHYKPATWRAFCKQVRALEKQQRMGGFPDAAQSE